MERIEAVVIGAGQAGLAASHELSARGIEHVVLERGVVGHTWRTRRWRSFRLVSPNSLDYFLDDALRDNGRAHHLRLRHQLLHRVVFVVDLQDLRRQRLR